MVSGECASITELAAAEKIDRSYLCRVLRLTLLAPEIVEAIVDGRQPEGLTLPALMKPFSVAWELQFADPAIWRPTSPSARSQNWRDTVSPNSAVRLSPIKALLARDGRPENLEERYSDG